MTVLAGITVLDAPLGLVGNASGTTLYVNATGSGGAFDSIQDAINSSTPGDTVYVFSGTYYENVVVNKTITLQGEDRETTVINGTNDVLSVMAHGVTVSGFNVTRSALDILDYGIYVKNAENCTIYGNKVSGSDFGIAVMTSHRNIITGNYLHRNNFAGIRVGQSHENEIFQNTMNFNDDGIFMEWASNNEVMNNSFFYNDDDGVVISSYSSDNIVFNNYFYHNSNAVHITHSSNNTITKNRIQSDYHHGIILFNSYGNEIGFNNISSISGYGTDLLNSSHNKIHNNSYISGDYGLYIRDSSSNMIEDNSFSLYGCGIYIKDCEDLSIENNSMTTCSIMMEGDSVWNWASHTIDSSNTVNGKPVYYLEDQIDDIVPEGAGEVILANCMNITVQNQELTEAYAGLLIGFSSRINVIDTTIYNNHLGLYLCSSSQNDISRNDILGNYHGISLASSSWNDFTRNKIKDNFHGIEFNGPLSTYNRVYTNSLIDNNIDARQDTETNFWNESYPIGGNYWSDSGKSDNSRGPNQDDPGGDGISDHAFYFTSGVDRYPLMYPWDSASSPEDLTAVAEGLCINLSWSDSIPLGDYPVLEYRVYRGSYENAVFLYDVLDNLTFYCDTDVINGNTYYYKVRACSEGGYSLYSECANASILNPPFAPQMNETEVGDEYLTITWDDPTAHDNLPIINYTIYRGFSEDDLVYHTTIGNLLYFHDTGLSNGVTYYYRIKPINSVGEGPLSGIINATPGSVPSTPLDFMATPRDSYIELRWNASLDNGGHNVTNYRIYKFIESRRIGIIEVGNTLIYNDILVTNGVEYTYRVCAENSIGIGPLSLEVSATSDDDFDGDGIIDYLDPDDDNDGVMDHLDVFPFDGTEWTDWDMDGIGDNSDTDDDNDGVRDEMDDYPLDPTRWKRVEQPDLSSYLLLVVIFMIITLILVLFALRQIKGKKEPKEEQPVMEEPGIKEPPPPPSNE